MSFFDKVSALLPLRKKAEEQEYFFAINIGVEDLTAALWTIEGKKLKVLDTASQKFSSNDEIIPVTDRLLDQVLGLKEIEPQKILFGVPNSWLVDENLKDESLKILRNLVKELELTPMAYVATSHSLAHFLEKQKGVPTTGILVGFQKHHLVVTVVRAGKIDGVKLVARGENCGSDIEKALLSFTSVETLPSKILIYGLEAEGLKHQLLSFSWMSNLSFLHFPKIEVLEDNIEIKSVCLAGASELSSDVSYADGEAESRIEKTVVRGKDELTGDEKEIADEDTKKESEIEIAPNVKDTEGDNFGFIVGDVEEQPESLDQEDVESEDQVEKESEWQESDQEKELTVPEESPLEIEDFQESLPGAVETKQKRKIDFKKFIPKSLQNFMIPGILVLGLFVLLGAYIFLPKADVKIFVEPKVLEKDAQVIADPNQKTVDEEGKIIPGQIIQTEVSGTAKDTASGKRQIGDPAKGTIVIYNKTSDSQTLSKGTKISNSAGIKFTLDTSVTIASQSASDSGITFGKAKTTVTAAVIGADGNLSSGTEFAVSGYAADKVNAKAEGNFAGGTSKDVTVVSSEDQQRLLAKLSSDLRIQAQQKLQEKYPEKKILQEALSEQISSKKYSKNINDQASEFSLTETVNFKGTAFEDKDLRLIVSKLVNMQVPEGFRLDLSATETQADVSKLEKDGKLIFLARFKAKLMPKIDSEKIIKQIKFKTPAEVTNILKGMDNILGSEITFQPALPAIFQRLPLLSKNIKIEVGLK